MYAETAIAWVRSYLVFAQAERALKASLLHAFVELDVFLLCSYQRYRDVFTLDIVNITWQTPTCCGNFNFSVAAIAVGVVRK